MALPRSFCRVDSSPGPCLVFVALCVRRGSVVGVVGGGVCVLLFVCSFSWGAPCLSLTSPVILSWSRYLVRAGLFFRTRGMIDVRLLRRGRHFGGGMSRTLRGLIGLPRFAVCCVFFAFCSVVFFPRFASAADTHLTQQEAYLHCLSSTSGDSRQVQGACVSVGVPDNPPHSTCLVSSSMLAVGALSYQPIWNSQQGASAGQPAGWAWGHTWCVPPSCPADGVSSDGQTDWTMRDPGGVLSGGGTADRGGCCVRLVYVQAGWSLPDKSDAWAVGHLVYTGARCLTTFAGGEPGAVIPKPDVINPAPNCPSGQRSCFNPTGQKFCAQSESGEWFCVPKSAPDPGGCVSGATGALCVGKNGAPPPPPDPPISSGTPPDSTGNVTINDGGTVNNYTTNNYSGTSPGGSGSSPPSSSPGGTGTNTGGSGNSGQKGTDSNGNCPDGSKPTASGCSGTYRDAGCDVPPQCYGDAVLCGIAANTHKSACAASGSTAGPPGSMSGDPTGNGGDPSSSSISNSVDLGSGAAGLDAGGFGYASSCPLTDGLHFTFLGKSIDVDTSAMCTPLSFIYYIVLAFAYFTAAKIMAGVK